MGFKVYLKGKSTPVNIIDAERVVPNGDVLLFFKTVNGRRSRQFQPLTCRTL